MSSYAGIETENYSLNCPSCGEALERGAFEEGRHLARCWHCGKMVRAAVRPRTSWSALNSGQAEASGRGEQAAISRAQLETAPSYGPPNFQCPYCEHINREVSIQANQTLYCGNCGAALKKACLDCNRPIYILDHFCPYCRADQERVQYELEALYWQQFNEGKRLAKVRRWEEARHYLAIFFDPAAIGADPIQSQQAQQIYRRSIAPEDGGEGLRFYNEALHQMSQQAIKELKQERRREWFKWGFIATIVGLVALWSALTFGSWWAIFAIVLLVGLALGLLAFLFLISVGGM